MSIERSIEAILVDLPTSSRRLVSLVPSYTESLFDLGFGAHLVGITDYCIHPVEGVKGLKRVGGVYDPRVEDIIALAPDLVIANQEENRPESVHALSEAGLRVWLTFSRSVSEMFEVLVGMVELFHDAQAASRVRTLEAGLDWAEQAAAGFPKVNVFVPIWQEETAGGLRYWMTFNQNTYASDLLERLGFHNIFATRDRCYPLAADLGQMQAEPAGDRDVRYPRVTIDEVVAAQPEVILLPDEPYPYQQTDVEELMRLLEGTPAVHAGRVYLIDGSLIAWYGTRLGQALNELPGLLSI